MSGANIYITGDDPLTRMRHVRKVVTFLNSSGTVDVFTITGEVMASLVTARCTTSVVEDGAVASIELGGATDPDALIVQTNPSLLVAGTWWKDATPIAGHAQVDAAQIDVLLAEDVILKIIGGTDLDSGVLVFNAWYLPNTDDGLLVAA